MAFRKPKANKNLRKRGSDSDEDHIVTSNTSASSILKKKKIKSQSQSVLSGTTKHASSHDQSMNPSDQTVVSYQSSGTAASLQPNMATRVLDVDSNESEIKASQNELNIVAGDEATGLTDSLYQGLSGYKEYVNKKVEKVTQFNAGGLRAGPLKGTSHVRISCRFDYAPDVCKDYKDTGYCGYGDSCKFVHDRSDYLHGWEIDKAW